MSLAQGNNTPTRPRIEPGSPDPESDALTTRPVRSQHNFVTDKVPKAITQKALMQELRFLNSACHLILVDICMKIHENSLKAFQVVELTRLRHNLVMVKVPWEITHKV